MAEDINTCPICWDQFRCPKLLPCRHTFCVKCLHRFVRMSDGTETLTCPICRALCAIPVGGVNEFLNNYFVWDFNLQKIEEIKHSCDMCRKVVEKIKKCSHCGQNMCVMCACSHKKAIILSGESVLKSDPETSSGSDTDSDSKSDPGSLRLPMSPLMLPFSLGHAKSKYVVSLASHFQARVTPDPYICISCLHPISGTECLVVPGNGPTFLLYDMSGNICSVFPLQDGKVSDIASGSDGSLFVALMSTNLVLKIQNDTVSIFTKTGKVLPNGIGLFPDGRMAVIGQVPSQFKDPDDKLQGELQIYSKSAKLIKTASSLLSQPLSVTVNKISGKIFVSDRGKKCVFIFSDSGHVLEQYDGGDSNMRHLLFKMEMNFRPLKLCQDIQGNILVVDASSASIHILDCNGKYLGHATTNNRRKFGLPHSIAIDPKGKLWVGDNNDGTIRVYESGMFENNFDRFGGLDLPSFPFHRHFELDSFSD